MDPILFGKYQLLSVLARGGMGEVWKARAYGVEGFEKILVIKRILPELSRDPRFVEMFIDEAKLAVSLTHANIVQVFDLGVVDGMYFIAMEYVPGLDLGHVLQLCKKVGRTLPVELCVYVASELAKALDYAHRRRGPDLAPLGIVHRDVSPENVLLSHEGEVKLTDFGIAKSRDSIVSPVELPPGKYAYLAPEQARQEELDARADVFALGAILFELLSGEKALVRDTPLAALVAAAAGEHASIAEFVPEIAPELFQIVARAMAPERALRHVSASELYEELIQFIYTSGRRVGALDLSRALADLVRESDEVSTPIDALGPLSGIEDIFGDYGAARGQGVGRTPLHVPARSFFSSIPAPLARGLNPRPEWREVSVLAVSGVPAPDVLSAALRFGGEEYPNPGADGLGEVAGRVAPLTVFGLGDADGRDAQTATRCALRLVHDAGSEDGVHALVHSGRLLLDAEGRASHGPSVASLRSETLRWLERAHDGVSVSSPAAKQMRARFELSPPENDGPRRVVRELNADEGVGKFVGRREELRAIGDVFASAHRGELRVLGVRGEAGSGKSRLLVETLRRLRHAGHEVGMYVANCALSGRGVPLGAVHELVRVVLGIEEGEPEARTQEKIDRLRQLGLSSGQRDAIARLLGLRPTSSGLGSTVMLEGALLRIAYKLAQDRLTVFAWDGAELMDPASREFVRRLLRTPLRARVVVVLAYRPGEAEPWTSGVPFEEVVLRPLTKEDVGRVIRHRLGVSDVPEELVAEVYVKTGGNPLYVEELLSAMRESAAIEVDAGTLYLRRAARNIELPRTLRGLIASRVGKLSQEHRSMLQLAVTIGSRFSPDLLARAAQLDEAFVRSGLTMLEARDIVRAIGPSDYTFAHELVRDVLYGSISLEERPLLHAAVAQAIEALRPAEQELLVDRLAYHHREAGNRERATIYLVRAAERYDAEHAFDAALDAYGQAIELMTRSDAFDVSHVLILYGRLGELAFRTHSAETVADRLGTAIELAERAGRDDFIARFAMLRGRLLNKASRFQEGRMWLERAQTVAKNRGDMGLERDIALAAAEAHARNGEFTTVIQYVGDALSLARATDDPHAQVRALIIGAPAYAAVGERDVALSALSDLAALTIDSEDRLLAVECCRVRASVLQDVGEHEAAMEAARQAVDLAREYGLVFELATTSFTLATLYLRAGEEKRAFPALRQSYELATEHGFARLQWLNVCLLGYVDVMSFGAVSARTRMLQAVRYAEDRGYVSDIIVEKYLLATAEQKLGNAEAAASLLHEVLEMADQHGHVRVGDGAEQALRALQAGRAISLPR